jgi:hypothetical protein
MRLYDIDEAIVSLIDEETGEITDFEAFENLNIERERKIDYLCKDIKESAAIADAIQVEIKRLQDKRTALLNKGERHKAFLTGYLGGNKFKSPMFTCYYGKNKEVVGDTEKLRQWLIQQGKTELLKIAEPELRMSDIKKAITDGENLPFVTVQDKQYLCIR